MFDDVLSVVWKERKSQFRVRGSRMRFLMMLFSPLLLGTIFPITWGPDWLTQLPPLVVATITSVILVAVMVPESIAGERERHTLETLLSSSQLYGVNAHGTVAGQTGGQPDEATGQQASMIVFYEKEEETQYQRFLDSHAVTCSLSFPIEEQQLREVLERL